MVAIKATPLSATAAGHLCLVARTERSITGTSRFAAALSARAAAAGWKVTLADPAPRGAWHRLARAATPFGLDAPTFLSTYPLTMRWPAADVYHLTSQGYAGLLLFQRPPGPVVVTVHDVIPYLTRNDPRLSVFRHPVHRFFDYLALRGLHRADILVADSEWTRDTLTAALARVAPRIRVVPLGVDAGAYRPMAVPASFKARYALRDDARYVLYVGSEEPRKNLETLWRAVRRLRAARPDVQILKAGIARDPMERARLLRLGDQLGISHAVRFLEHVPEADLPLLYNAVDLFVMPSLYEGYGLPVLEAMACGTPVACSRSSALVEVAGDAAHFFEPLDDDELAAAAQALLDEPERWRARGLARAAQLTQERTLAALPRIYTALAHGVEEMQA